MPDIDVIIADYERLEKEQNATPEGADIRQIFIDLSNKHNVSFAFIAETIRSHTAAVLGSG